MITKTPIHTNIESLMGKLASKDGVVRQKARDSLVALGKPAVSPLSLALWNSKVDQVRWEAAKTLGAIGNAEAVPALVGALNDGDADVAWLAAEGLKQFEKAAWPELMRALIEEGADSIRLRRGAHHVLWKQRGSGFDDLLDALVQALESKSLSEYTLVAAHSIIEQMEEQSNHDESRPAPKGSRKELP